MKAAPYYWPTTQPAKVLPPITWDRPPVLPLPEVTVLPPADGWRQWDLAVALRDRERQQ